MSLALELTRAGLFCPAGGFHIDPSRAVDDAVITHSHSDHARAGSRRYWCASSNVELLRSRIGSSSTVKGIPYGEKFRIGNSVLSFHPAGHILGSAQVRIECETGDDRRVWVVSGDYKRDDDPTCDPFEVVPCDVFITEATFGLPIYRWESLEKVVVPSLIEWWAKNADEGYGSVLYCYSLGKAQRVLAEIARVARAGGGLAVSLPKDRVLLHGTAIELTDIYRDQGVAMIDYTRLEGQSLRGELAIVPPGAGSRGLKKLGPQRSAFASGWMICETARARRGYERGFVISDHADFPSLVRTVRETGAKKVLVTHGSNEELAAHLRSIGVDAQALDAALEMRA